MKVFITGICGFVGSEIALRLQEHASEDSVQIVGIDNLCNGSWRNRDRLTGRGINVRHGDVRCVEDLETVGPTDWVIDASANPSVLAGVDGQSSSRQLVESNLTGTINLLEYCKKHQAGFVLLSTSRVYSIPPLASLSVVQRGAAFQPEETCLPDGVSKSGITEDFSTAAPVSLYGASKLASEQLALEYGLTFGFPVWVNRCGVMAGAGQFGKADQGIFAYWLHSWKENRPLKYIGFGGHGYQVRDCLHPRDVVPLLLKQCETGNGVRPSIINVSGGSTSATSLAQLSRWCTERWGQRQVGSDQSSRPFDLPWVVLDHSAATESWGWRPTTSLNHILEEIADFAETQPDWIESSK